MAHQQGKHVELYIERDDGQKDRESIPRYFSTYDEWPDYEKKSIKHAHDKVLDIGCGAGRHSLWFQENGLKVTSVDISPRASL